MKIGIAGLLLASSLVAVPVVGVSQAADGAVAHAGSGSCPVYKQTKIAYSLGILESLLPDNHGGMLLSASTGNAVERLLPNGHVTVLAKVASPGQLVWRGETGDRVPASRGSRWAVSRRSRRAGRSCPTPTASRSMRSVA
jgi:hypothetical protein